MRMPFTSWVLSLMVSLQSPLQTTWSETFEETAEAIADVAMEEPPLFDGEDGRAKTAALLVAVAWAESRFDPHALGDHGQSVGPYQVSRANLIVPASFVMDDAAIAAREALRMMRTSFAVCRGRPALERLGWYAAGGDGCRPAGLPASRRRVGLAVRLFRENPYPTPPEAVAAD